ncbi:MAG: PAS domain-containing protein [Pararhodobacter sp.]|nr:PAS domain-containing protein [Pararhodobacter sp.]
MTGETRGSAGGAIKGGSASADHHRAAPGPETALAALISALPEPVLLVGADGRVLCANAPAQELFGPHIEGAPALAHFRQPETALALERALAALAGGQPVAQAFTARKVVTSPSRETIYRLSARPLPAEAGVQAVLVALHDISHVEEAEQQRRDFVANVSHELRSPLTVLAGFIETLQGSARDDAAAREEFLRIMAREAHRMTRLVDDLLSLSRVESNEKVRPRDAVSLSGVLRATLAALRPQIEAAGVTLDLPDMDDPATVPGDREQLVQVFHNLVENALKYGADGKRIEITLQRLDGAPGIEGPAIRVAVADHGAGIDPIHLPRLTERFYRIGGDRARESGGTGLGLAIVKHIVNRHRGRLQIRSRPGEGSEFSVVLPCR